MSGTPEYGAWSGMWQRCTNQGNNKYHLYHDKTPPDSWRRFETFYAELGDRPSAGHSLDRIDNRLPYGPGNCKWSTQVSQCRNKSNNVRVIYRGVEYCLKEAAEVAGLPYQALRQRWRFHKDVVRASGGLFQPAKCKEMEL